MEPEELYKKLLNREDLRDIPIMFILKVAFAVVQELLGGSDE